MEVVEWEEVQVVAIGVLAETVVLHSEEVVVVMVMEEFQELVTGVGVADLRLEEMAVAMLEEVAVQVVCFKVVGGLQDRSEG